MNQLLCFSHGEVFNKPFWKYPSKNFPLCLSNTTAIWVVRTLYGHYNFLLVLGESDQEFYLHHHLRATGVSIAEHGLLLLLFLFISGTRLKPELIKNQYIRTAPRRWRKFLAGLSMEPTEDWGTQEDPIFLEVKNDSISHHKISAQPEAFSPFFFPSKYFYFLVKFLWLYAISTKLQNSRNFKCI